MRLLLLSICTAGILLTGCQKQQTGKSSSSARIDKDGVPWMKGNAVGTFNTTDSIISIMSSVETERLTIRFKKPAGNIRLNQFEASTLISPFFGSAAISDRYMLDTSKINKVQILITDETKKRIVGDFYLHLKREEAFGEGNIVYSGRFDVLLNDLSF